MGSGFNNKAVRETMKKVTEQWAQQTGKEREDAPGGVEERE